MILLWIILFSGLLLDPVDTLLEEAERAYERWEFEQAISLYMQVLLSEPESGAIYYNLGNAYYGAGFLGEALVNYRRGQRLLPRDSEIATAISRIWIERVDFQGEERFWLDRLASLTTTWLTPFELHLVGLTFWIVWIGAMVAWFVWNDRRRQISIVFAVVSIFLALILILLASRLYADANRPLGVVTAMTSTARSGPGEDYIELFQLYNAAEVRIIGQEGDWLRCQLPDGSQGWFLRSEIEEV